MVVDLGMETREGTSMARHKCLLDYYLYLKNFISIYHSTSNHNSLSESAICFNLNICDAGS
jgi:hypothetical protein